MNNINVLHTIEIILVVLLHALFSNLSVPVGAPVISLPYAVRDTAS